MNVKVASPWILINNRYEIAVALDYPGSWTNTDVRFDPAPRGLMIAEGVITAEQAAALAEDERYFPPDFGACGAKYIVTPDNIEFLLASPEVKPGDRLIMRGEFTGDFVCSLRGSAEHPIVIEADGAEIDGTLKMDASGQQVIVNGLFGHWTGWTTRTSTDAVNYPPLDLEHFASQSGGFRMHMPGGVFRRCRAEDYRTGFGFWNEAWGALLEECETSDNGWESTKIGDADHGEDFYGHHGGENAVMTILNCSLFRAVNHPFAFYSTNSPLRNMLIKQSAAFMGEIQVGGNQPGYNLGVEDCYFFALNGIYFGFGRVTHHDIRFLKNVIAMARQQYYTLANQSPIELFRFEGNEVIGNECSSMIRLNHLPAGDARNKWTIRDNHYFYVKRTGHANPDITGAPFWTKETGYIGWDDWRGLGFDQEGSSFTEGYPPDRVIVRPSRYAPEARVDIYNWTEADRQLVALDGLPYGPYQAINVQNREQPGYPFEWNGEPVELPMMGWTARRALGHNKPFKPVSFPQFGEFFVRGV